MDRDAITALIEHHEGRRHTAYVDTTGHLTVGVGFNLDSALAAASVALAGLDYNAVRNGEYLTDVEIDRLLDDTVSAAIFASKGLVKNFYILPDRVQAVIVDLCFNLGSPKFSQFVKFRAALEAKDYNQAAAELENSRWCGQVKSRCADNVEILRSQI